MSKLPSLSILLPCFNEEDAIPKVVMELIQFKEYVETNGLVSELEIIVIDDGSKDNSRKLLQKYIGKILIEEYPENRGYGYALKRGIRRSKGEWIGFYDLDETCHAMDLLQIIEDMSGDTPVHFCGVRMHSETKMPRLRFFGNSIYRYCIALLTGRFVGDGCSGFRVFHKSYGDVFSEVLPDKINFTLAMTVFTLRNKLNYKEFNINYTERAGQSKLNPLRDGLLFFKTIINYRFNKEFLQR